MLNTCCITHLSRPKTGICFYIVSTPFDSQTEFIMEVGAPDKPGPDSTLPREMRMKSAVVSYAAHIVLSMSFQIIGTPHGLTSGGECPGKSKVTRHQSRSVSQYSSLRQLYKKKPWKYYASAAHPTTTLHISNQSTKPTWHSPNE